MKCTYTYKGKNLTFEGLKRNLIKEMPSNDMQESIKWLSDYLGMESDEVMVVAGLIEGKALGKLRKDASILLSNKGDIRIAKHEAFHRVWRAFLSPQERSQAIWAFKQKNKNWKDIISPYRKRYGSSSEEELIEEFFADEFEDFNPETKTWQPLQSIFQRLFNLLKKVMGIKPSEAQTIYQRIYNKEFKSKRVEDYISPANKVIIEGITFSIAQKNDIVNYITQSFIEKILNSNAGWEKASTKISILVDHLYNNLVEYQDSIGDEMLTAITEDIDKAKQNLSDSVFMSEVVKKLKKLGLGIKEDYTTVEKDGLKTREFASSVEFDPKTGLSTQIKLLLASFKLNTATPTGVPQVVSPAEAFNKVASHLLGVPSKYALEHLEKINVSFKDQLLSSLGWISPGVWNTKNLYFRNEFFSKMLLTENKFQALRFTDDDIYLFDLNNTTRVRNLFSDWSNSLVRDVDVSDKESVKVLREKIKQAEKISNTNNRIVHVLNVLHVEVPQQLYPVILPYINKIVAHTFVKDGDNIYRMLNIEGNIKSIAEEVVKFEGSTDFMIDVNGTNIYSMGLNTYQTIALNKLKFLVSYSKEKNMSDVEMSEFLKQEVPEMFNSWNINKDGLITNPILAEIIYGNGVDLTIPYTAMNEVEDSDTVDMLNQPDLMSLHIHGALKGYYVSMKHSDRSTFFAYKMEPLFTADNFRTLDDGLNIIVKHLEKQIQTELDFAKSEKTDIQYIGKNYEAGGYISFLGEKRAKELFAGDTLKDEDRNNLKKQINSEFESFYKSAIDFNLTDGYTVNGLSKAELKKYLSENDSVKEGKYPNHVVRKMLMAAFTNEVVFHMYESRLFSGDNRVFSNVPDLFKRLATQSSNGNMLQVDSTTNDFIKEELDVEYEVFDITQQKTIKVNTSDNLEDFHFRAITSEEVKSYTSRLLQKTEGVSKLGIENPSIVALAMEAGFLADTPNPTEKQKELYLKKIELAESKYSSINENDGQSYMTLPAFKNYMIRLGQWSDEMDVAYQIEMALLKYKTLDDAKNMSLTIKGKGRYAGLIIKPFQIEQGETWFKRKDFELKQMHTLKTQYGGPSFQEMMGQLNHSFYSVFKTSQHLLQPSAIMGTNLSGLNTVMLESNVQIMHMGSANKVGGVDAKLAAKRIGDEEIAKNGLTFYNDNGEFNSNAFRKIGPYATYLSEWNYLKDQVKIGNKEKSEIAGSTQSLKLMLANLFINGNPRFEEAVQIVQDYKSLVTEMVQNNSDELFREIGWDGTQFETLDQLKNVVMESSQLEDAPQQVKNQVEDFFNNIEKGMESLPLRQKIENVLYALITRNVVEFKRPGNSYPQAAVTGYEPYGQRQKIGDNYISQELDFYEPVFVNGKLVEVKPAEVVIPLPQEWIADVMRMANTNNIIDALNWINNEVLKDKNSNGSTFIVKGLRIPNQQLSSNDIFRIKKFTLPTITNYAIVPSEIVIKVGSDYDIDKLNLFWPEEILNLIAGKQVEKSSVKKLLDLEQKILLHPRNIQHLLMPLTNDIFVEDLYRKEFVANNLIEKEQDSLLSILNPATNVKKAIIFVKGKFAVGIGALGITFHVLNQVNTTQQHVNDNLRLNPSAILNPKYLSSRLRFEGLNAGGRYFGNYTDSDGNLVSEIMSQLLTMYVDGVKEPYAVLMNITMQTANVVDYLVKAGLSARQITFFLSQPLIKNYLLAQLGNEALFNKQSGSELTKVKLLEKVLKGKSKVHEVDFGFIEIPSDWMAENLKESLAEYSKKGEAVWKDTDYTRNQVFMLQHFLEIQELSKAYGIFTSTQNSDTTGFSDIQDILEDERSRIMIHNLEFTDHLLYTYDNEGLISPFYQNGRKSYNIFRNFYLLNSNSEFAAAFNMLKFSLAESEKGDNKTKIMSVLENDLMLYLAHQYFFSADDFDRLMKGDSSTAKRVKQLKTKLPDNIFLKNVQPVIGKNKDPMGGFVDSIRMFEKKLDAVSADDLSKSLEEIAEYDFDLYKDIIHTLYFQNGFNKGVYNFFELIPYGEGEPHLEVIKEVQQAIVNAYRNLVPEDITRFLRLFDQNNPQFIKFYRDRGHTFHKSKDRFTGEVYYEEGLKESARPVRILGNKNIKRYNVVSAFDRITEPPLISNISFAKNEPPSQFYFQYKGVSIPTEFELGDEQKNALITLIDYVNSDSSQPYTLEGSAGTGKTTIIGYLQKYFGNKRFLYMAPTHAATVQLAFSTVKTGNNTVPLTVAKSVYDKLVGNVKKGTFTASAKKRIGYRSVVVVDESSMLDEADIKRLIEASEEEGVKLIFMGDSKQIPKPDTNNPSSKTLPSVFLKYPKVTLTSVFRQKNPELIDMLTATRNSTEDSLFKPSQNSDVIQFVNKSEFDKQYVEDLVKSPDTVVQIAYDNNTVQSINSRAREVLGRTGTTKVGDVLVGYLGYATKQVEDGDVANSIHYTLTNIDDSESFVVLEMKSSKLEKLSQMGMKVPEKATTFYYQLSSSDSLDFGKSQKAMEDNNNIVAEYFRKIHSLNLLMASKTIHYNDYTTSLVSIGKELAKVSVGSSYVYNPATDKMELYSYAKHKHIKTSGQGSLLMEKDVDYGHAITVHKSQGATFETVYFNADTLSKVPSVKIVDDKGKQVTTERQAIAYVALSRASKKLAVTGGDFKTLPNDRRLDNTIQTNNANTQKGILSMQPDNIEKIKSGLKTITNRTSKLEDGVYTLPDGSKVVLEYMGFMGVSLDRVISEDTDTVMLKNTFAQAEGFKNWNDFESNNKYSSNFVNGLQSRYVYKIKKLQQPLNQKGIDETLNEC